MVWKQPASNLGGYTNRVIDAMNNLKETHRTKPDYQSREQPFNIKAGGYTPGGRYRISEDRPDTGSLILKVQRMTGANYTTALVLVISGEPYYVKKQSGQIALGADVNLYLSRIFGDQLPESHLKVGELPQGQKQIIPALTRLLGFSDEVEEPEFRRRFNNSELSYGITFRPQETWNDLLK